MTSTLRTLGLATTVLAASYTAAAADTCTVTSAKLDSQISVATIPSYVELDAIAGRNLDIDNPAARQAALEREIKNRNAREANLRDSEIPKDESIIRDLERGVLSMLSKEKQYALATETVKRIAKSKEALAKMESVQDITVTAFCSKGLIAAHEKNQPYTPITLGRAKRGTDGIFRLEQ